MNPEKQNPIQSSEQAATPGKMSAESQATRAAENTLHTAKMDLRSGEVDKVAAYYRTLGEAERAAFISDEYNQKLALGGMENCLQYGYFEDAEKISQLFGLDGVVRQRDNLEKLKAAAGRGIEFLRRAKIAQHFPDGMKDETTVDANINLLNSFIKNK